MVTTRKTASQQKTTKKSNKYTKQSSQSKATTTPRKEIQMDTSLHATRLFQKHTQVNIGTITTPKATNKKQSKIPEYTTQPQPEISKVVMTLKTVPQNVKRKVNIPNLLTMFRIWAIPVIVAMFFFNNAIAAWMSVFLFFLAGISDYMDGYLARHWNQLTRFGRILDPIADKLLISSILLMLAFTARLGDLGIIPAVVILCREILVSGLREFLAEIKVGCPVTRLAKWKTACQMFALPMLMLSEPTFSGVFADSLYYFGQFALWGAAVLTVMTGYDYWKSGRKYITKD